MTVKLLLIISAVLTLALGVTWIIVPEVYLSLWGLPVTEAAVYMSRRYAVLFLGYAVICWMARHAPPSPERRAILAGGFTVCAALATISLVGVLSGSINVWGWQLLVVEVLLASGFAYHLFIRRQASA